MGTHDTGVRLWPSRWHQLAVVERPIVKCERQSAKIGGLQEPPRRSAAPARSCGLILISPTYPSA
jgi:hypothetical protein